MKRLSRWCIIYYFVDGQIKNFLLMISMFSLLSNVKKYKKYIYALVAIFAVRLLRGFWEWLTTFYFLEENSIQVTKGLFKREKIEIHIKDIQGVKISENWIERRLGVFNFRLSIKGSVEEKKEIVLKCVPEKYKQAFVDMCCLNNQLNQNDGDSTVWQMEGSKIILASVMSISWTYLLSLMYIKDDIEDLKIFPVFSGVFLLIDNFLEQETFLKTLLVVFSLGILFGVIVNSLKYYKYKVSVDKKNIIVSRGSLEKSHVTFKINSISSYKVTTNVISELCGFGKLSVEGKEDSEQGMSLDIIPFEKKGIIDNYLEQWFGVRKTYQCQFKKNMLIRMIEIVFICIIFLVGYVMICKFLDEQKIIWVIVMLYIGINMILKSLFTNISMNDKQLIIHKAGIKSEISYVFLSDIVNVEVEECFLQRTFGLCNAKVDIISNSDEQTFSFRNFRKRDINKFINIWRKSNEQFIKDRKCG